MWVVDSSGKVEAQGDLVGVKEKATQSTKFNALWKESPGVKAGSGPQCYQVEVLEGSDVWVGLAPESKFGPGWSCKGFLFGGNLSDGGALMRQRFGPRPQTGDKVGIRAELGADGTLTIHYSLNGQGLGKAFELTGRSGGEADLGGALYPLVSFSTGPSRARISSVQPAPAADAFETGAASSRTSVNGDWVIPAAALLEQAPQGTSLPNVKFSIDTKEGFASARVANTISVPIHQDAPHGAAGVCRSTRMMPPSDLLPVETRVSAILESLTAITLEGDTLKLASGAGAIELAAHREVHSPVARGEINWLN